MQRESSHLTDRELLRAFKRKPSAENFQPFLDRYLPFVLAAARRQSADEARAAEVTRSFFLGFAKRAHSLLPKPSSPAGCSAPRASLPGEFIGIQRRVPLLHPHGS